MIERYIIVYNVDTFISGMAIGIDMWSAICVIRLKEKYPYIKLICAIPCVEQYAKWNKEDTNLYHKILNLADDAHYVSDKKYSKYCMINRDKWMVDNSSRILAVWNEGKSGGTWSTIRYAKKKGKEVYNINPDTYRIKII